MSSPVPGKLAVAAGDAGHPPPEAFAGQAVDAATSATGAGLALDSRRSPVTRSAPRSAPAGRR